MAELNLADQLPALTYTTHNSITFVSGNTKTVTDANVKANSVVFIMHTSAWVGHWYITVSAGSFLITSSDAENNATFKYLIF